MINIVSLLLYGIPCCFLIAVLMRTFKEWSEARARNEERHIPTEPIVLMVLGFVFLSMNRPFVAIISRIAEAQLNVISPNFPSTLVSISYGTAAIVLIASFAKAFWTHLNLEDGNWGPIANYRKNIWPNRYISFADFWLRVLIAIMVVILQKQIAALHYIPYIQSATQWNFRDAGQEAEFIFDYREWLALTVDYGAIFFSFIFVWLCLASFNNRNRPELGWAIFGTIGFALPGLVLCLMLNYLATGTFNLFSSSYGQMDAEFLVGATVMLLVVSFFIIGNLAFTICQAFYFVVKTRDEVSAPLPGPVATPGAHGAG